MNQELCPVTHKVLQSHKMNRILTITNLLNKQRLRCKNSKKGCEWVGKLNELEAHTSKDCKKQKVKCGNKECTQFTLREEIEKHINECEYRIVKCMYCFSFFPFNQIIIHEEECPKMKLMCPQKCQMLILREDEKFHIENECLNTEIVCPYLEFNCNKKMLKKELNHHLEKENVTHTLCSLREIASLHKTVLNMKNDIDTNLEALSKKIDEIKNSFHQFEIPSRIVHEVEYQIKSDVLDFNNNQSNIQGILLNTVKESSMNMDLDLDISIENAIKENMMFLGKKTTKEPIKQKKLEEGESSLEEGEERKENSFDVSIVPQGIYLSKNTAKCVSNSKDEHLYVLGSISVPTNKDIFKWKVKIIESTGWIGIGLCCKDVIVQTRPHSFNLILKPNHGIFCISTNGYIWNSNVLAENNVFLPDVPLIKKGDRLKLSYSSNHKMLIIRFVNNKKVKLRQVHNNGKGTLTPCVILVNPEDEVKLTYL